ncbi:MAG: indole-3-glycerol phosphate synthase TrpC [Patescibacteria group bacterium]
MKNLNGFLGKIYPIIQERVQKEEAAVPLEDLKRLAAVRTLLLVDIKERIVRRQSPVAVIGEIKHASPNAGMISGRDHLAQVQAYVDGGAVAISVLTEPNYFNGSLEELKQLKESFPSMPFLRKDFIISEYQVYESKAAGADLVLLITRWLEDDELKRLFQLSRALGLQVLVEVEQEEDFERAMKIGAEIIGINARSLVDLTVDVDRVVRLARTATRAVGAKDFLPLLIGESGVVSAEIVRKWHHAGVRAVLVGEALMKSGDPVNMVRALSLAE